MSISTKLLNRMRRRVRIRASVSGTAERPRLSVYISNQHVTAQLIDDVSGRTLAASSSKTSETKGSLSEQAAWVGQDIAAKALKTKIKRVIFDRNARKYHGRVKLLADKARAAGLEF